MVTAQRRALSVAWVDAEPLGVLADFLFAGAVVLRVVLH